MWSEGYPLGAGTECDVIASWPKKTDWLTDMVQVKAKSLLPNYAKKTLNLQGRLGELLWARHYYGVLRTGILQSRTVYYRIRGFFFAWRRMPVRMPELPVRKEFASHPCGGETVVHISLWSNAICLTDQGGRNCSTLALGSIKLMLKTLGRWGFKVVTC